MAGMRRDAVRKPWEAVSMGQYQRSLVSGPKRHRSGGSQMIARHHIFEIEFIRKTGLPTYRLAHHRPVPLAPSSPARNHDCQSPSKDFFNTGSYKQSFGSITGAHRFLRRSPLSFPTGRISVERLLAVISLRTWSVTRVS